MDVQLRHTTVSRWMRHASRSPYSERRAPDMERSESYIHAYVYEIYSSPNARTVMPPKMQFHVNFR